MSVLELALKINEIINNPAGIVVKDDMRLGDDPERRRPDISKAKTLLNWEPEYSLTQGLSKTIPYFRTKLGIK